jgi:hypothetical protein
VLMGSDGDVQHLAADLTVEALRHAINRHDVSIRPRPRVAEDRGWAALTAFGRG